MLSSDRSTDTIGVVLVDDQPAIREAIGHRAEEALDMQVAAETGSAEEAFRLVVEQAPEVVVVELFLGGEPSFELLNAIDSQCPTTQSLVFTVRDETVYAERALRAGASGYLMKRASMAELLAAVRQVAKGRTYLSSEMTTRVLQQMRNGHTQEGQFPISELTAREREVFQMLGQGMTMEGIADRLDLTRKTAETHRRRVKEKLGYETIDEVISHAARWMLGAKADPGSSSSN